MAIASCLVDTNVLIRITRRSDPQHELADAALATLAGQGPPVLHAPEHRRDVECNDARDCA